MPARDDHTAAPAREPDSYRIAPLTRAPSVRQRLRPAGRAGRIWPLLAAGLVVEAVVFLAWAVAPIDVAADVRSLIGDAVFLPAGLVVALLAWRTSRSPGRSPAGRVAWRWLTFAYLTFWCGDVLYFVYDIVAAEPPYPSIADAAYLAYYPLQLVGLLSLPRVRVVAGQRLRFALDATTVAVGGAMLVWYFVLGPIAEHGNADLVELIMSIAYPVGDLVLVLGVAVTLIRIPTELPRRALALLLLGVFVSLAADLAFASQNLEGIYEAGRWVDGLFLVAWAMLGVSALIAGNSAVMATAAAPVDNPRDRAPLAPYLAVALGYGMLVVAVQADWTVTEAGLVVGAGCLTALVVARQIVAVRENTRLVAEHASRRSEARFRSVVQNASDLIVVVDRDYRILYETPSVERVLGYNLTGLVANGLASVIHPDDRDLVATVLRETGNSSDGASLSEVRIARSDGSWIFVEASTTNLLDDPDVGGIVLTIRNVDERKRLELKLAQQAYHDPLTGLANRRLFTEEVDASLASKRSADLRVGLLFLDVDNLKTVNDSLGHDAGDRVLVEISRRLEQSTRASDLVARVGGDEFAILLDSPASDAAAMTAASHILAAMGAPCLIDDVELSLGASIGVVVSDSTANADELLREADAAMYVAKASGKGRAVVFAPGMQAPAGERLDLEARLRHALDRDELDVYFQPILDLSSRTLAGAETLVRWRCPGRGLVMPSEFIPIAEETGLIVPIGAWILEEACRHAAGWNGAPGAPDPYVAVNLSARQLEDSELVDHVAQILARTGLHPTRLELEITESLVMQDPEQTIRLLNALKELGIRIAVDDFGTGYSSLGYLRRLPVDTVKIDRSFVADLDRAAGFAITSGIVNLAHSLGLAVVAEGIEVHDQADALEGIGCEYGQGFMIARPMPAAAFLDLLAADGKRPVGDRRWPIEPARSSPDDVAAA